MEIIEDIEAALCASWRCVSLSFCYGEVLRSYSYFSDDIIVFNNLARDYVHLLPVHVLKAKRQDRPRPVGHVDADSCEYHAMENYLTAFETKETKAFRLSTPPR